MAATSDEEMDSLLSTLNQIYQVGTNLPLPPSFLTILYTDSVWLPRKPRKKNKRKRAFLGSQTNRSMIFFFFLNSNSEFSGFQEWRGGDPVGEFHV